MTVNVARRSGVDAVVFSQRLADSTHPECEAGQYVTALEGGFITVSELRLSVGVGGSVKADLSFSKRPIGSGG
jgi:hypothetical protein